jgi:hypothetical protein
MYLFMKCDVVQVFDTTKISDLADCLVYDILHNSRFLTDISKLYYAVKKIADFVVCLNFDFFFCTISYVLL